MEKKFMRLAIDEALFGVRHKHGAPFGAVIAKNGKVIASEHNHVLKNNDPTAHAEIVVIRKAAKKLGTIDLSDCEIYSNCEPCPMCFSAIHWAKIKKIYFGAKIADAKKLGFGELEISNSKMKSLGKSKVKVVPGVMRKECLKPFKEFAKSGLDFY
ncbi:tRNA-specific adenosine deaminase [uncultured archaeon]|nr:tRNA-specific adenosine deaminase [uncultured archaeon]